MMIPAHLPRVLLGQCDTTASSSSRGADGFELVRSSSSNSSSDSSSSPGASSSDTSTTLATTIHTEEDNDGESTSSTSSSSSHERMDYFDDENEEIIEKLPFQQLLSIGDRRQCDTISENGYHDNTVVPKKKNVLLHLVATIAITSTALYAAT